MQNGIASLYPDINGLPELKSEASKFIKAFIDIDLKPEGCVPVTGSMQGTFASFLTCSQCDEKRYYSVHRSWLSGPKAAIGGHGTEVRDI